MLRLIVFPVMALLSLSACSQQAKQKSETTATSVDVVNMGTADFDEKLKSTASKIVLDVRTDEEFNSGHLQGAINMNVNDPSFGDRLKQLDTTQPVFVYCLAGGRSARAAEILKDMGFPAVYNMEGGVSRWTYENRPLERPEGVAEKGMKTAEFKQLIASQKEEWVLVDFWAKWCAPCKKITAYLPEIEKEFAGKISIVKINYDDNPRLVKELGLDNVPYLFLYKKGTEQWKNSGYIEKEALRAALNKGL